MKVAIIHVKGVPVKALIVDEHSPHRICENCSTPCFDHPDLVKEDRDWCVNCNDDHYRGQLNDYEMGMWTLQQMAKGKIVAVVTEVDVDELEEEYS